MRFIQHITLLLFFIMMTSCGNNNKSDSSNDAKQYSVKLSPVNEVELLEEATLRFTLYGAIKDFTDGDATILRDDEFTLTSIPEVIIATWPDNDFQLIDNPPVSSASEAIYFFNLSIDINNDGLICEGDYIFDYENTSFWSIESKPTDIIEIYVRDIKQGCSSY